VRQHLGYFASLSATHLYLALVPVLIALAVSLPLGALAARHRAVYAPLLGISSVLYALPSLAAFVILLNVTALSDWTVMIPLATYALAILLRSVTDGLVNVAEEVRTAATAMGYGSLRRLISVELPAAVPVLVGGLRLAAVSSISLVSVGALVGIGGLGVLFTDGETTNFSTEIIVGIVLILGLAVACDLLLVAAGRLLTPWQRAGG
jgi:osmoprotectant transport system permease protein